CKDGLQGAGRFFPREFEILNRHRPFAREPRFDDRLAKIAVGVEEAKQSVDARAGELARQVGDRVVPANLPVRHEVEARPDLFFASPITTVLLSVASTSP